MAILLELLGFVMILAGVVLLFRAASSVRADLVARITGCSVAPDLAADQISKRRARQEPRGDGKITEVFRLKSFEENIASLNQRMGRESLNEELRDQDDR